MEYAAGSGAAFGPVADTTEGGDFSQTLAGAERVGAALIAELGAYTAGDLRNLSSNALLSARPADFSKVRRGALDTMYPIIDGKVLLEDPYTTFRRGNQNDVPLVTGSNSHERGIFNSDTDTFIADYRGLLGANYERFAALYPSGPAGLTMRSSKAASADRLFSWQNWAWANGHARSGTNPVFYYHFAHQPPVPENTFLDQAFDPSLGAYHTAELYYSLRNLSLRQSESLWLPEVGMKANQ